MNKILIGLNAVLLAAVAFLFLKIYSGPASSASEERAGSDSSAAIPEKAPVKKEVVPVGTTPTGKIAFVNIDELDEKSLEMNDLIREAKRRRSAIESSIESLSMQYQKKMEEYQNAAKAGILPASDMQMKEKEILAIEKDARNKQLQMDELSGDINDKNDIFRNNVKNFLIKWNEGRYDYILSYSENVPSMLLGNATLEVTDEVIAKLNEEYRTSKNKIR